MEFARGCRPKNGSKIKNLHGGRLTGLNSHTLLVINLPDSRVWRVVSRSVFLAMVILILPGVGSIFKGPSESNTNGSDHMINSELLNLLFQDLAGEGLLRKGDKALIVSDPGNGDMNMILQDLHSNEEVDVAIDSDFEKQSSISNETFDFVFTSNSVETTFVNRVLKIGGIVALPLSNNPPNVFRQQPNYKLVYLRRYSCTIMALKKISPTNSLLVDSSTKRHLCQFAAEAKKVVLKGLEDVLLEPPRRALAKSNYYLSKINFLPDLLGDSLEGYKRRVFIGVGLAEENSGVIEWFHQNYPKRNQDFEAYSLEEDFDVSDWLKKNVEEEEYVVMKAEAEVVEEMMKRKTIRFVDELFLECNNQWWQDEGKSKSKRAYWECLALYGRLRDEGVAVHQWWG